jgi:hypothetical protein
MSGVDLLIPELISPDKSWGKTVETVLSAKPEIIYCDKDNY